MNMKEVRGIALLGIALLLSAFPFQGFAETVTGKTGSAQKSQVEPDKGGLSRITDKGLFAVTMVIEGRELAVGANSLNLMVRDRQEKRIAGAKVAVTPWMPGRGYGVWDKPVVTDRGEGNYHVANVVLARSGRWDLIVVVKRGAEEDRATFSFSLGPDGKAQQLEAYKPKAKYLRTVEHYSIPNVTLLNQEGKKVRLRPYLDSGRPVMIDFVYTTCTTICPVLSAGFADIQKKLGKDAKDTVQLVSISIDPERDRPEEMKKYLARYGAREGWDFLTGSRTDINLVLKTLDAAVPDKMEHLPLYIIHGPKTDEWVRIKGLIGSADLMHELRRVE